MKVYNGTGKEIVIYDISTCELIDMKLCITKDSKILHTFPKNRKLMVAKELDNQRLLYNSIPTTLVIHTNAMSIPNNYDVIIVNNDYYDMMKYHRMADNHLLYIVGLPVYDERGRRIIGYQSLAQRRY